MMKKQIISIVTFIVVFCACFIYLNKVFKTPHFYVNTTSGFEKLADRTNIDVVFYGSSHAYTSINPLIINNQCNTISYNLGSSALRLLFSELVILESLKHNTPQLMVVEVHSNSIKTPVRKKIKYFQYYALDFIPNYVISKFVKSMEVYEGSEFLGVYSPLIRNHSKWNIQEFSNLDRKEKLDLSKHYYAGFRGAIRELKKDKKEKYKDFQIEKIRIDSLSMNLTKSEMNQLDKIIDIAEKNSIPILFYSAPTVKSRFNNYNFYLELDKYFKDRGVEYVNTNDYLEKIGLDFGDFRDVDHLNTSGSNKMSQFLANQINKNFSLADRSSDVVWKESRTSLDKFELLISKTN